MGLGVALVGRRLRNSELLLKVGKSGVGGVGQAVVVVVIDGYGGGESAEDGAE